MTDTGPGIAREYHVRLVAAGFRALVATTGKEGVAFADEHLPDVVLMETSPRRNHEGGTA